MPRSILEILLEKKNPPLVYPSESHVYNTLNILLDQVLNNLSALKAMRGFGGVEVFGKISEELKSFREGIESDIKDLDNGTKKWNDPKFQESIGGKDGKGGKIKEIVDLVEKLGEARINSLGEKDAFSKGNTFFETGESLVRSAEKKFLEIATIRDNQIKSAEQRSTTDLFSSNKFDTDKLDITAKKTDPSSGKNDKEKKEIEKQNDIIEETNKRLRMGLFYYLAMILSSTQSEIEKGWGNVEFKEEKPAKAGETAAQKKAREKENEEIKKENEKIKPDIEKQRAKRLEYLQKALPFIESITGKDFDDKDPASDEIYMKTLMALASYTPGFKNYEPDIKEENIKITGDQYKKISEKVGSDKKNMLDKLDLILKRHGKNDIKDTKIREKIEEAKKELEKVDPKTACDYESLKKLQEAKADIAEKIKEYGKHLEEDDKKDLEEISVIIDAIFDYCYSKEYSK
jgi:hypothetical protein